MFLTAAHTYSALSLGNVKKDLHIGGPFWRFRERAHTYVGLFWKKVCG